MHATHLTTRQVEDAARGLVSILLPTLIYNPRVYAIPRGGLTAYYILNSMLREVSDIKIELTVDPSRAGVILDDLYDSGATMQAYAQYPAQRAVLFSKGYPMPEIKCGQVMPPHEWVVFPWEHNEQHSAEDIPRRLLQYIGEDPNRGGLLETPKRMLKAWKDWTWGYKQNPADILKVFEDGAENYNEMVIVKDIPVYSQCEHHLAPFFGVAHIGYIPDGKIVGLSKLSRLTDVFAKRLQVQERLTNQIADAMQEHLQPLGIGVVLSCRHMCMESRGIQRQGSKTLTSAMRGVLHDEPSARAEFMALIENGR